MDFIFNIAAFIVVISAVVFVHELGHFCFARIFGVRVEVFSVGFGPKIFKYLDSKKTEWRLCAMPLGGYVKMYGDADALSVDDYQKLLNVSDEHKAQSFCHKPILQRSLIVIGGPLANYVLATILFAVVLCFGNISKLTNEVLEVQESSSAHTMGFLPGDVIVFINGVEVKNIEGDLARELAKDDLLIATVKRDGEIYEYGLGVQDLQGIVFVPQLQNFSALESMVKGVKISYKMSSMMLDGIWKMLTGQISSEDLGGPIRIAQYSADAAKQGFVAFFWFIAVISLNIGLLNLMPIPILDGGRLLFYIMEFIFRRPVSRKIQTLSFRLGLIIMMIVMVLATFNDIKGFFNL